MRLFSVAYITNTSMTHVLRYDKNVNSWIGINVNMIDKITPPLLSNMIKSTIGIDLSEEICKDILEHPVKENFDKDVTVVFRY